MAKSCIAARWRELSGEKDWNDLLDPLDSDLCRYIIHYGQMTAAAGDLFKGQTKHMGVGDEPYPKQDFFTEACLVNGNKIKYAVTHYIYATLDDPVSEWIGYVAVSTDEAKDTLGRRDIFVAWRGTQTMPEWKNNANAIPTSTSILFGLGLNSMVHEGFLQYYIGKNLKINSARDQVRDAVRELLNKYGDEEEVSITVTGFSLGAALATLNAMDMVANGYNKLTTTEKSCMVTVFTFGGPRVGNDGFEKLFKSMSHSLHLLRITNAKDSVPTVPWEWLGYIHVGSNNLQVDTSTSSYLQWRLLGVSLVKKQQPDIDISALITTGLAEKDDRSIREVISPTIFSVIDWINSCFDPEDYCSAHNMDVYLHGVAIKDKKDGSNIPEEYYDIALVNKHLYRLKDKYGIPAHWWDVAENRIRMEQMDDGRWIAGLLATRSLFD